MVHTNIVARQPHCLKIGDTKTEWRGERLLRSYIWILQYFFKILKVTFIYGVCVWERV